MKMVGNQSNSVFKFLPVYLIIAVFAMVFSCNFLVRDKGRRIVVLTFDDAVKSHRTIVAPILQELGFGGTFFITHRWMEDTADFMSWGDVAELHEMGFEIGNHTWSHSDFSFIHTASRLEGEIGMVDLQLSFHQIPKPASFAYPGNAFCPTALSKLKSAGYKLARRGMQPEINYGNIVPGPLYDPQKHHPLLIPSAGDAYPDWTLDHFKKVVDRAGNGKIAVLQFHGIPDLAHPHVHLDPDKFKSFMNYLKEEGFEVLPFRELLQFVPDPLPEDPYLQNRFSLNPSPDTVLPVEVKDSRVDPAFWLNNMFEHHYFTIEEAAQVFGVDEDRIKEIADSLHIPVFRKSVKGSKDENAKIKVLPYPGGRHPRTGFLDGAIDPLRGTKASVFLPWDTTQYIVIDIPEAIFSQDGLIFLAHTHFPTVWDYDYTVIENKDWHLNENGSLENLWTLPNNISFGAKITPGREELDLELWIKNGTEAILDSLKTQVCIMLKGAEDFHDLTNDNKKFNESVAATGSGDGKRWILTGWDRTFNPWGNPDVPCMHTDPKFTSCKPGISAILKGKIWFYEGDNIEEEMREAKYKFESL